MSDEGPRPSYRSATTIVVAPVCGRDGREERLEAEFGPEADLRSSPTQPRRSRARGAFDAESPPTGQGDRTADFWLK